ncbi:hypothetical protein ACFL2H_14080 [Planctomycetota bacterium]
MKVSWFRIVGASAALLTSLANIGLAGKHFFLRSRPPVRRDCPDSGIGIPKRDYYKSETRLQQSVLGTIGVDQPRTVSEVDPVTQEPHDLQRKQFRMERSQIAAGQLHLSRIGVAIDSSGQLHASALISHNGGLHLELDGGKAVVKLRIFTGVPGRRKPLTDATVIHEFKNDLWVVANTAESILLAKPTAEQTSRLKRYFDTISHVEIVLEHIQDVGRRGMQ